MHRQVVLLALASFCLFFVRAAETPMATDMGPAAFLWPPDRVWGAAQDNTAPCGSSAGVTNRTKFPLTNGKVSLVLQDESYNINLAISYQNNPTENKDFTAIEDFPDLVPGHECYDVTNPPKNIASGSNATLQISYLSTFDTDKNETYYACADITYVELSAFKEFVFCRNITAPETTSTSTSTASSTATASTSTSTSSSSSSKGSGLSGGQIAGIVIGSLMGVALIAVGAFLLWSRHQRQILRDKIVAVRMSDWGSEPVKPTSGQS